MTRGVGESWHADGARCTPASTRGIDHVALLRALIKSLQKSEGIDPNRVSISSHFNGCAMAQRLAADASDVVAAVASMAHDLSVPPGPTYAPLPVLEIQGTADAVVAYKANGAKYRTGAEENFKAWAAHNGCTGAPTQTWQASAHTMRTYQSCKGGAKVALLRNPVKTIDNAWAFVSGVAKKP